MTRLKKLLKAYRDDESGATAIEYAMIAGLIAIAIITAVTNVGAENTKNFEEVAAAFPE